MAEKDLTVRSRFKLDTKEFEKIAVGVKKMREDFKVLETSLPKINTQLEKTLKLLQGISKVNLQNMGGGGGGNTSSTGGITQMPMGAVNKSADAASAFQGVIINEAAPSGGGGGVGGGGGGGAARAAGRGGQIAGVGLQALTAAIQAVDNRMASNYDRSLGADKLGVYYQQTRGISNRDYINQFRSPLTGYRLGYGGIDSLLALQASTGLNAQRNAGGVEMLRTVSGYSYSTGDIGNMMATMSSAQVNNRMTMMLGTGMYGPGGQQRDIGQVIKDITKRSGLTNENVLKGARQSGSVTRVRLEAMGVPPDMIDMVLDYAESNVQYQKKTGSVDMYDPSRKRDRTLMGIEDNFATQAEETARVKEARDEKFYSRQADNFADFEKNVQKVTAALGRLEDALSSVVGARIGNPLIGKGSMGSSILGGLMVAGGIGLSFTGAGAAAGIPLTMLGATMMSGGFGGDPVPSNKTTAQNSVKTVPFGYGGQPKRMSLSQLETHPDFAPLHTTFKQRLLAMFAENPNVGLGDGIRSEAEQERGFLSRYKEDPNGEISWNGKKWRHVSGAPMAPPGKSMHEIGLAADLVGDLDWVVKNAHRFGLKHFGDVLNEPWHVQPAELPNSRWEYEKKGAVWGMPATASRDATNTDPTTGEPVGGVVIGDRMVKNAAALSSGVSIGSMQNLSMSQQMAEISAWNQSSMAGGGGSSVTSTNSVTGSSPVSSPQPEGTVPAGAMDPVDIARILYARGFDGKDITNMLAISGRESRWKPSAYNGKGRDRSYGLFQINMFGEMGPVRRARYGISKDEELFDPRINIKAARLEFGDGNYRPWTVPGGTPLTGTEAFMPKAQAITKQLGLDSGDPMPTPSRGGGGNVQVNGGSTINVAPNIYITSSGNTTQDARRLAQEIMQIMEREVRKEALRSS